MRGRRGRSKVGVEHARRVSTWLALLAVVAALLATSAFAAGAPTVSTGTASLVTATTATLNAKVTPKGVLVTACTFEYGPTTSYGSTAPCTPAPGSSATAVAVSAEINGLTPGTEYHVRIVATNAVATGTGKDKAFQTPSSSPTVTKLSPTKGSATGGTLVTITGTNLTGVTAVKFGTTAGLKPTFISATAVTAESPPGAAGKVDVTVTTPQGPSAVSTKDKFTYSAPKPAKVTFPTSFLVRFDGYEEVGLAVGETGADVTRTGTPVTHLGMPVKSCSSSAHECRYIMGPASGILYGFYEENGGGYERCSLPASAIPHGEDLGTTILYASEGVLTGTMSFAAATSGSGGPDGDACYAGVELRTPGFPSGTNVVPNGIAESAWPVLASRGFGELIAAPIEISWTWP
jgi:hypothetical protein